MGKKIGKTNKELFMDKLRKYGPYLITLIVGLYYLSPQFTNTSTMMFYLMVSVLYILVMIAWVEGHIPRFLDDLKSKINELKSKK